ncbi:MAG: hypothetical protein P1V97_19425 [Planctomycetota bacterium]|nr:hypothetical protein [Planctomycetota bacterium]
MSSESLGPGAHKAAILYIVLVILVTSFSLGLHFLPGQERAAPSEDAKGIDTLRSIMSAENIYRTRYDRYGHMKDLVAEKLLSANLEDGEDARFRYSVFVVEPKDSFFYVQATPLSEAVTSSHYFGNQNGVIYRSTKGPVKVVKGRSEPVKTGLEQIK